MHRLIPRRLRVGRVAHKRAECRILGERERLLARKLGRDGERRMEPRADGLAIAFRAGELPRHMDGNAPPRPDFRTEPQVGIEKRGRVDEGVAVHDPIARKLGAFESRNHAEHASLLGKREVGLKPDKVVAFATGVLGTQLERRPRPAARARVGEPHGLQGAEPGSVDSRTGDLFNRLARLEEIFRLEFPLDHTLRPHQLMGEGLVFLLAERSVQVIARALLVAALGEELLAIEGLCHDDGRRCVEEGQVVRARCLAQRLRQIALGQGPGSNDERIDSHRLLIDAPRAAPGDLDEGVGAKARCHLARERIAVDGERAARGYPVARRDVDEVRPERGELRLEHSRSAVGISTLKRVRAHELCGVAGFVHGGAHLGAHLDKLHANAAIGKLERRLAAREPCTQDAHHTLTVAHRFLLESKRQRAKDPACKCKRAGTAPAS